MSRVRRRSKVMRDALDPEDAILLVLGPSNGVLLRDGHMPFGPEEVAHVMKRDGPQKAAQVVALEMARQAAGRTPDNHPEVMRLRALWAEVGPDLDASDYPWARDTFGTPTRDEED